jgi:hemerythrin-like metal-binding protein
MTAETLAAGQKVPEEARSGLWMIREGSAALCLEDESLEELKRGDFIGSSELLFGIPSLFHLLAETPISLYFIPRRCLSDVPIVRWKLYENYLKRMRRMVETQIASGSIFQWRSAYETGIADVDEEHRRLFEIARNIHLAVRSQNVDSRLQPWLRELRTQMDNHFETEERLMNRYGYPGAKHHRQRHRCYRNDGIGNAGKPNEAPLTMQQVTVFFRNWMIHHVLTEDRKLGVFLRVKISGKADSSQRI